MQRRQAEPIDSSYWVQPGRLPAGECPAVWSSARTRSRLRRLVEAGITFFVDLTEEGEKGLEAYAPLLQELAAALGLAVQYRRMPIPDFATPTVAEMKDILDMLDVALAAGRNVYVHCFAGIGRTGTVVGCYLVRHGWSGKEALAELVRLRRRTFFEGMSSPVTSEQQQMVLGWSLLDS